MKDVFEGKNCIITGASTGIGFGLSKRLLERGANVYMCSRTPESIQAASKKLEEFKDRAHFNVVDVRFEQQVKMFINSVGERCSIDYLFNNAGIAYKGPFIETTVKMWEDLINCNLYGVIYATMAAVPIMLRQGGGHIINVSSLAGIIPSPYQTIYCASKYAVMGFSESLRYELADKNIRVTVVCPGYVDTMILKRGMDYKIYDLDYLKAPPEALSPEQAADEILEGIEAGQSGILPVTDFTRRVYDIIKESSLKLEPVIQYLKKDAEEKFEREKSFLANLSNKSE